MELNMRASDELNHKIEKLAQTYGVTYQHADNFLNLVQVVMLLIEVADKQACNSGGIETNSQSPSLRDQFAMAALTGILISGQHPNQTAAQAAYDRADDMLAERERKRV